MPSDIFFQKFTEVVQSSTKWRIYSSGERLLLKKEYIQLTLTELLPNVEVACGLFEDSESEDKIKVVLYDDWIQVLLKEQMKTNSSNTEENINIQYCYLQAAQTFRKTLLRDFNFLHNTTLRLGVTSRRYDDALKLSKGIRIAIRKIFISANIEVNDNINTDTWEALYEFIRYSNEKGVNLSDQEFRRFLVANGVAPDTACRLSDVYFHGRNILCSRETYSWLDRRKKLKKIRAEFRQKFQNAH
jgi:hypothetical protein